jgi:lipoprotein-anchoring transpeptidase ErfK/SrfK
MTSWGLARRSGASLLIAAACWISPAGAQPLSLAPTRDTVFDQVLRDQDAAQDAMQSPQDEAEVPAELRRQMVNYPTREAPGTIIVDTPHTYLYLVLGQGRALRYGVGVGREGFTWSGVQTVVRKVEWPDWTPPAEMLQRQPYLPRLMAGGPGNPLGARALYLGNTIYRIHGTNAPDTIGHNVSSGCIRMLNADVVDLYSRVNVGTKVVVLPASGRDPPQARRSTPATVAAAGSGRGTY